MTEPHSRSSVSGGSTPDRACASWKAAIPSKGPTLHASRTRLVSADRATWARCDRRSSWRSAPVDSTRASHSRAGQSRGIRHHRKRWRTAWWTRPTPSPQVSPSAATCAASARSGRRATTLPSARSTASSLIATSLHDPEHRARAPLTGLEVDAGQHEAALAQVRSVEARAIGRLEDLDGERTPAGTQRAQRHRLDRHPVVAAEPGRGGDVATEAPAGNGEPRELLEGLVGLEVEVLRATLRGETEQVPLDGLHLAGRQVPPRERLLGVPEPVVLEHDEVAQVLPEHLGRHPRGLPVEGEVGVPGGAPQLPDVAVGVVDPLGELTADRVEGAEEREPLRAREVASVEALEPLLDSANEGEALVLGDVAAAPEHAAERLVGGERVDREGAPAPSTGARHVARPRCLAHRGRERAL